MERNLNGAIGSGLAGAIAFATIQDHNGVPHTLPDEALHGLAHEAELDLAAEPGSRIVTVAEVKASTGSVAEG